MAAAFRRHASTIEPPPATDGLTAIAVGGKTLRGSFDALRDHKAAHMMSALRQANLIMLAHVNAPWSWIETEIDRWIRSLEHG